MLASEPTGTMVPAVLRTLKLGEIFHLVAKLVLGLHDDLPGAAEQIEVVDVQRALIDLQRVGEIAQVDPLVHALAQVGIDLEHRHVGAKRGEQAGQFGLFVPPPHEVFGLRLQRRSDRRRRGPRPSA